MSAATRIDPGLTPELSLALTRMKPHRLPATQEVAGSRSVTPPHSRKVMLGEQHLPCPSPAGPTFSLLALAIVIILY